jgi:hypothetical protein
MSKALKYFSKPFAIAPHILLPRVELAIRGLIFPMKSSPLKHQVILGLRYLVQGHHMGKQTDFKI